MKATSRHLLWIVLIGLCLSVVGSASAEDNLIRFGPSYHLVVGDYADPPVDLDDGFGIFVDYERTLSEKFGLDFGYEGAIFELGLFGNQDVDMIAWTVRANYYVKPGDGVRFFVHPTIGYVDLDTSNGGSDSALGWGAGAGVDCPLGQSRWVFAGGVSYLTADVMDEDFSLVSFRIGFGRRF